MVPSGAVAQSTWPWQRYPMHCPLIQSLPVRHVAPVSPRTHLGSWPKPHTPLQQAPALPLVHPWLAGVQLGRGLQRPFRQRPSPLHAVSFGFGMQRPCLQRLHGPHGLAQPADTGRRMSPKTAPSPVPLNTPANRRREIAPPRARSEVRRVPGVVSVRERVSKRSASIAGMLAVRGDRAIPLTIRRALPASLSPKLGTPPDTPACPVSGVQ
jgi:hypothetical protein